MKYSKMKVVAQHIMMVSCIMMLLFLVLAGCANSAKRQAEATEIRNNYQNQLNTLNRMVDSQQQMAASALQTCESDNNPGLCAAYVSDKLGIDFSQNGQNGGGIIPSAPQPRPSFGERLGLKVVDGLFSLAPFAVQWAINKDNTDARVKIAESENNMLSDIVGGAYDGLTEVGSMPSYSANGDVLVGDDNVTGDGNTRIIGDNNRNAGRDLWGDGNISGDDNIGRDDNHVRFRDLYNNTGRWNSDGPIDRGDCRNGADCSVIPDEGDELPDEGDG